MFILVKNMEGEDVIIGSSHKEVTGKDGVTVYEVDDEEFSPDMIYSVLEDFDEV